MSFWQRLFSKATPAIGASTFGDSGVAWTEQRYDKQVQESYLKNVIAFRCISEIASAVSSVPWNLYRHSSQEERIVVENHPIIKLLTRANPSEGFAFLMFKSTGYLVMTGNTYLERVSPDTGPNRGIPKELYSLRPDQMKILVNNDISEYQGQITAYQWVTGATLKTWDVDPITGESNILHLKTFHPLDE